VTGPLICLWDPTRARTDYLKALAESNKAQCDLSKAVGPLSVQEK
jgi:hypothetical protein